MPLLQLADHALFDPADADGVILDTRKGEYLSLNEVSTLMLQAGTRSDTLEEALARLRTQIDATDETLKAGLELMIHQLERRALLALAEEKPV